MKDISKKTGHRKPVQYRARHKNLRNLKEEDTKHGFDERIKVKRSLSHPSEPVYCGVWPLNGQTESIELNSSNYRSAATKLEDNIRVARPPSGRKVAASAASASPSSSTYSADISLQEFMDDFPYREGSLQLTHTDQTVESSQPDHYPRMPIPTIQEGFLLPISEMQHIHLPTVQDEDLNFPVPGYTGYPAAAYANQGIPSDVHVPMDPHNLNPYFYPDVQQPYHGIQSTSNQPIPSGWEPDPNHIWNHAMVDGYFYDHGSNAPNIPIQFPEFYFPAMDNNQYMPHPNHPNVNAQNGYYAGP